MLRKLIGSVTGFFGTIAVFLAGPCLFASFYFHNAAFVLWDIAVLLLCYLLDDITKY